MGQGFIDGKQIGWMDFDLFRRPQFADKVDFLRICAQLRVATREYLTFGRLWEPVMPTQAIPSFEEEFREGGLHKGRIPFAEARLWQAEDGHLAVFLVNYGDADVPFSYALDPAKYGLTADRYDVTEITPGRSIPLGKAEKRIQRTELLKANSARVIEFVPAR